MAVRVRQVTRTTQPQDGVPLNLSHPLARGIVAAYSFAEKGRNLTGDADLDGTIVGSMSFASGGAGIGLVGAYQASNNYLSVPRTSKLAYTTQVTFEALVRLKSPQTTAFPYLSGIIGQYQSNSGGTSSYYGPYLRLNSDASSGNARQSVFSVLQGGVEHLITGPDLADGQLTYIIGTYDGSRIALFVNGVKYSASLTGAFDNDASNFISIGSEYVAASPAFSNNRCFNGDIYWAAIRDVGLTDAEGIALSGSLNPWQLFEPEQIVVKAGAATGPTYTLTAAAGTFTLTGQAANLVVSRKIVAATGSFALTGQAANLTVSRKLTAATGAFALTGQDANLVVSRKLTAATGVFAFTGNAANLVYTPVSSATYTLTAQTGTFNLTGQAATLKVSRKLVAETVAYVLTGNAANFYPGGVIPVTTKGGNGKGKNLTLKQKKKLKAVVNQEWLKAEQTAKELLQDRLGNIEPAKARVERLTTVQSLADVITALQALSKETVTLPEQQAVIKSFEKSIDTKVVKTGERLVAVEDKVNETLGRIEKKIQNLEDLLIVVIDELL